MSTNTENIYRTELHRELKRIFFKTLALRAASGLVSFLAISAWIFLAVVLWTALTREPPLWQALIVSRTTFALVLALFGLLVVYPLFRVPRVSRLAREVESRRDFKDIVAAGYEFSTRDDVSTRYAPELVREVIRQAVRSISGLQVRFLFLGRRQLLLVPLAYAALAVLAVLALTTPAALFNAGQRITSPKTASAVVHQANLFASPGNMTVLAGSDVEVTALDFGGSEEPVVLSYNLAEGFWKTEPTEVRDVRIDNDAAMKEYAYKFNDIRNSVTYYFQSGDQRSEEYRIEVVHKPIVTDLQIVLTPPAYTGEPSDTLVDSGGNIQALEGTQVAIDARANNELKEASVRFDDEEAKDVAVSGRSFKFEFQALRDGSYGILLEDNLGHRTDEALSYAIEVYKDNPPVLDVLEPGDDSALPRNLQLDVGFIASDDYGVKKAAVFYRKGGENRFKKRTIALGKEAGKRDVAVAFTWDLGDISLFPGNFIEYFLQVEDNNVVTGPGVTKSRIFHITVPTMAELYEKVQQEDSRRSDLFDEALKESKELKERVEKISREFKKTEELDWSQKKEIDKAVSSQEAIQEKLEEIQSSLEETLESLSDNQMTSQQIGEKLEEIQRLIEQIDDEALNKYIEELREAMQKLNPDDIQEALKNLNLTSEDLLKNLERTASLLKEIQREQEMEELVRKTKDLLDEQSALKDETGDTNEGDTDAMNELGDRQEGLSEEAEQLQKDMEDLADELSGDTENPDAQEMGEQMENASEEFSESEASKKMKQASSQLQQGQKQQAMGNQQEAMDQLIALFNKMAGMQMQMQQASERRAAENLQRLAKSTLELSFKQERLTQQLRDEVAGDDAFNSRSLAERQQSYENATRQIAEELNEIAKRTTVVNESLLKLLGDAIGSMQSSTLFLEQNKTFLSTTSASEAVKSLNLATMELLSACKNCSGGGSGSGSQRSALQNLLNGQQQVLQQSQQLLAMRATQERLLQERLAAMKRLSGQQRSLQDMAREIEKQIKAGSEDRLLGRMDKMFEEMEEVIRDLESGVLDEETIRNEERILSRMLDAQRSVHSRDYEKKRLSVAADDVYSEGKAAGSAKRTSQSLREEIRRAMALKAPGEFEDLIKLYFRALAEESAAGRGDE